MALTTSTVVPRYVGAQYDGTNGPELLAQLSAGYTLVEDGGTVLRFTDVDTVEHTINLNEWMIWRNTDLVAIESSLPSAQWAILAGG